MYLLLLTMVILSLLKLGGLTTLSWGVIMAIPAVLLGCATILILYLIIMAAVVVAVGG